VELGATIFPTDQTMTPDELAVEVERRGFVSLGFPEHTHIPVAHAPYPGGGPLPEMYKRTLDPFVASTAAAVATTDLLVGTTVCLVAQHHPLNLAKQTASVDLVSGGRFEFGIGYGWDVPETEHHGVAFSERRSHVREAMLAIRRLWTQDVASYSGEHVEFGPTWSWPKPVRAPGPPVLLGASLGPRTLAHLVEFCDGWMPGRVSGVRDALPRIRTALQAAGRDPGEFRVVVSSVDDDLDKLRYLAGLGVDRATFWLPAAPRGTVLEVLDRFARLAEQL
jgi:probable F420-dependent oxidoreductase